MGDKILRNPRRLEEYQFEISTFFEPEADQNDFRNYVRVRVHSKQNVKLSVYSLSGIFKKEIELANSNNGEHLDISKNGKYMLVLSYSPATQPSKDPSPTKSHNRMKSLLDEPSSSFSPVK